MSLALRPASVKALMCSSTMSTSPAETRGRRAASGSRTAPLPDGALGSRLTLVALGLLVRDLHLVQAAAGRVDEEQRRAGLVHGGDARKIPAAANWFTRRREKTRHPPATLAARSPQQVALDGAVGRQPPLVHLLRGPVHDGAVHAVLNGQHADHRVAVQLDEPLHQTEGEALRRSPEEHQQLMSRSPRVSPADWQHKEKVEGGTSH